MIRHPKLNHGHAVHEAGHAVASLALGIEFIDVAVYTSSKMIDGDMCIGYVAPLLDGRLYEAIYVAMKAFAGPFAEAKYRKTSSTAMVLSGGRSDCDAAVEALGPDATHEKHKFVENETKKLVNLYWDEILRVADALMLHGTLDMETVESLAPRARSWRCNEIWNHYDREENHRRALEGRPLIKVGSMREEMMRARHAA